MEMEEEECYNVYGYVYVLQMGSKIEEEKEVRGMRHCSWCGKLISPGETFQEVKNLVNVTRYWHNNATQKSKNCWNDNFWPIVKNRKPVKR